MAVFDERDKGGPGGHGFTTHVCSPPYLIYLIYIFFNIMLAY